MNINSKNEINLAADALIEDANQSINTLKKAITWIRSGSTSPAPEVIDALNEKIASKRALQVSLLRLKLSL